MSHESLSLSHETIKGRGSKMRYLKMTTVPAVLLASLLGGMLGCATSAEDPRGGPDKVANVEEAISAPRAPTPVASLKLTGGQVIEFYDFGTAALVTETAAAYVSPVLNSESLPADQLVGTWARLAPTTPVPPALEDLQHRLTRLPADLDAPKVAPLLDTGGAKLGNFGSAIRSAPVGCNNGCCDFNWLATLSECKGGFSYNWFLYNYGWTYANGSNVGLYQGLVCSAIGTSTYSVQLPGAGGVWSVPQATYRWFHWSGSRGSMSSTVNSSSNSHLHTYCGGIS